MILQTELGGPLVAVPLAAHSDEGAPELPRMGNTSLTILEAAPPHAVRLLNCARQMEAGLREGAGSLNGG